MDAPSSNREDCDSDSASDNNVGSTPSGAPITNDENIWPYLRSGVKKEDYYYEEI